MTINNVQFIQIYVQYHMLYSVKKKYKIALDTMNPALSEKVHIKRFHLIYRKSTISPINWVPLLQHSMEVLGIQLWVTLLELSETLFLFFEGKVGVVKDTVHHGDQRWVCALSGLFLVLVWSHLTAVGVICKINKINIISEILFISTKGHRFIVRKRRWK